MPGNAVGHVYCGETKHKEEQLQIENSKGRGMAKRYVVYVDDNFHYMDESERYKFGEFDDCHSAIAACRKIVDEFLNKCDPKNGADEMFKGYTGFGEDPWISTDDPACMFSAWDYARERCRELAQKT